MANLKCNEESTRLTHGVHNLDVITGTEAGTRL